MAMDNITSNNNANFYWWFGVVEDRNDPLRLGRCRVRIIGYHTEDNIGLPTEDLPWAMPVMPANSAGTSGVGWSPTGAVEGSWVVGFFADGENGQHPMFFGTVGAIPGGLRANDCSPTDGSGSSGDSATKSTDDSGNFVPVESGPPNQEFWTLVALVSVEAGAGGGKGQDQCDVAQTIYNRVGNSLYAGGKNLLGQMLSPKQYEPVWAYPKEGKNAVGYKTGQPQNPNKYWLNITDANSASVATGRYSPATMLEVAKNLKNPQSQAEARRFVGSRTDFLGTKQPAESMTKNGSKVQRTPRSNKIGFSYDYRGKKIAQVPAVVSNQALA